jgi:dienelactone hydrolase
MRMVFLICCAIGLMASVASADERVTFESARYRVGELQQRLARERGETIAPRPGDMIEAWLSKPDGPGPFPAVVTLHGCAGLRPASRAAAADHLNAWGYVALVVDSFTTRRITEACDKPMPNRHADALGALAYLAKRPFVDPQRIALIGRSQGGIVGLQVASSPPDIFDVPEGLRYKAIVAFYPWCGAAADELTIPTLVMTGDADDWSPVKDC